MFVAIFGVIIVIAIVIFYFSKNATHPDKGNNYKDIDRLSADDIEGAEVWVNEIKPVSNEGYIQDKSE